MSEFDCWDCKSQFWVITSTCVPTNWIFYISGIECNCKIFRPIFGDRTLVRTLVQVERTQVLAENLLEQYWIDLHIPFQYKMNLPDFDSIQWQSCFPLYNRKLFSYISSNPYSDADESLVTLGTHANCYMLPAPSMHAENIWTDTLVTSMIKRFSRLGVTSSLTHSCQAVTFI